MVLFLRNTKRRLWHLGWYICLSVCVYVVNGITTPCLAKNIALRTPSTRVSLIRVEFESTHTEAGRVGMAGLVAWLEACVRMQQTAHSSGLRVICLGLSHRSKVAHFCFVRVSFHACRANASRPAGLTSLSFAVPNAFHVSYCHFFPFFPLLLGKVPFGSFSHHFKKDRPILSHKTSSQQLWYNGICTRHPKCTDHITQICVGGLYVRNGSEDLIINSHLIEPVKGLVFNIGMRDL